MSPVCPITGMPLEREKSIKMRDSILTQPINEDIARVIDQRFPLYTVLRVRLQGWWRIYDTFYYYDFCLCLLFMQ